MLRLVPIMLALSAVQGLQCGSNTCYSGQLYCCTPRRKQCQSYFLSQYTFTCNYVFRTFRSCGNDHCLLGDYCCTATTTTPQCFYSDQTSQGYTCTKRKDYPQNPLQCGSSTCISGQYCCTGRFTGTDTCFTTPGSESFFTCNRVTTAAPPSMTTERRKGLGVPEIVGISVAVIVVIVVAIFVIVFCCCRKNATINAGVNTATAVVTTTTTHNAPQQQASSANYAYKPHQGQLAGATYFNQPGQQPPGTYNQQPTTTAFNQPLPMATLPGYRQAQQPAFGNYQQQPNLQGFTQQSPDAQGYLEQGTTVEATNATTPPPFNPDYVPPEHDTQTTDLPPPYEEHPTL